MPTTLEWRADDVRYRGPDLPPKRRGDYHWFSAFTLKNREFSGTIRDIVDRLLLHKPRILEFVESGGKLELYLQLNGSMNIGDEIGPELLISIGELHAILDIEVFPNLRGISQKNPETSTASEKPMILFEEMRVWRRLEGNRAVRYYCFKDIESGLFAVQNSDFFELPASSVRLEQLSKQAIELFVEEGPDIRCKWLPTLREAIEDHEAEFNC